MILTLIKKLFKKKGEIKKESPMIQILDWGSTGFCFMNSCLYIIIILGVLISIGTLGKIITTTLEKVGVIAPISNVEKAAETVANNPTMQKLLK